MVKFNLFKKNQLKDSEKISEKIEGSKEIKEPEKNSELNTDLKQRSLREKQNDLERRFSFLIKGPILTEKASRQQALNKYHFLINSSANKTEIKKLIEKYYQVKIKKINILNAKKRKKRWFKSLGRQPRYKKAIVTLYEGYKIDISV